MKREKRVSLFALLLLGCLVALTACGREKEEKIPVESVVDTEGNTEKNTEENIGNVDKDSKVYEAGGYLAEKTELQNDRMLEKSGKHFTTLYEKYLEPNGIQPYFVIIPDKNYYLTEDKDIGAKFDQMIEKLCGQCDFMKYVDIRDLLSVEDYYRTDSHWKQDCIADVAEYLCENMGNAYHTEYETNKVDGVFKGSYYDQIATDLEPDEVNYLTNEILEQCIVTKEEGMGPKDAQMYNMEKALGENPYDMFLEGAVPIITVENSKATSGKTLIIFRDSFGSSITPLMVGAYQKITLVDIRYIQSGMVGSFVDFKDSDVLFLYSSILLNNSAGMK